MAQWGFYFNQDRCVGCKTCVLACKTWNNDRRGDADINISTEEKFKANEAYYQNKEGENEKAFAYIDKTGANNYTEDRKYHMKEDWRRVETFDKGGVLKNPDGTFSTTFDRRYMSISCNHCSDCACIKVCPMNVYYKDEDKGLTLVRRELCISCGRCKAACPYDAPQFYSEDYQSFAPTDPARPKVTKCTMCKDRIDKGLKPACVAACWNRALDAGPIEELKEKYKDDYQASLPEFVNDGTRPMIIFKAKTNNITEK